MAESRSSSFLVNLTDYYIWSKIPNRETYINEIAVIEIWSFVHIITFLFIPRENWK